MLIAVIVPYLSNYRFLCVNSEAQKQYPFWTEPPCVGSTPGLVPTLGLGTKKTLVAGITARFRRETLTAILIVYERNEWDRSDFKFFHGS